MSGPTTGHPAAALQQAWSQAGSAFPAIPVGGAAQACPGACLIVRFLEIKGLYVGGLDDRANPPPGTTKNASYQPGYASEDDRGRIFINHLPDGTWKKNKQYIEITVIVEPPSVPIPPGTKITWSFEDPDDPSNEDPKMHRDAGELLDPNDYSKSSKTGANGKDNDPYKKARERPGFEQAERKFALSGNKTSIDAVTRTSKVRFKVSDIAGDNYRVKADIEPKAPVTATVPATTGVMTVWHKINLEYVKMASAAELPVDQISRHFDLAFAQVDVALKRVVTGKSDMPFMGSDDKSAREACEKYATKAKGEFTMEGEKGWFFIAAANLFLPAAHATVLYEGDAGAFGYRIRLPRGTALSNKPAVVRVFNPAKVAALPHPWPNDRDLYTKFVAYQKQRDDILIGPHDFHQVDNPDAPFLLAYPAQYGFPWGSTVPVQVLSEGNEAYVTAGISPGGKDIGGRHYFGGRLIVFTQAIDPSEYIGVLCHELCHAFDNAHKCGNWDWTNQASRTSCCMNYWFQFVLDDARPRAPIPWTQNRESAELCAHHLRRIRDYHLEDNPGLGWGKP